MISLMGLSIQAQRCAVLEFKAGVRISQNDVDGISAIFITYFRPAGYTMVERTQIDKVIEEQGFQRSNMTQSQMVRVGQILNVSKIVVGDINVVMGQYNVDTRVLNVETGTIAATEGATFATSSYRSSMQNVAQKLAAKIAITPSSTVHTSTPSGSKKRNGVEILYGYLKIFPNELGVFRAEPTTVINQINAQAQYGYNNWRIPTDEELSLLRANNYLGSGDYMTRENKQGIVLLVTDGKDFTALQIEEQERQERMRREELERQERIMREEEERQARAEQAKIEAEQRRKAEQERIAALKAQGWVDLGLPSGTLWKEKNETGFYTAERAVNRFGSMLPTWKQFEELIDKCQWLWNNNGFKIIGPNGESMFLPIAGYIPDRLDSVYYTGCKCVYWSSDERDSFTHMCLSLCSPSYCETPNGTKGVGYTDKDEAHPVRLVRN